MSLVDNPHARFGFEYSFLFDGTWQVQGEPDPYVNVVIAYINVLGSVLQREGISPRRLRIAPFPDFSYRVVPLNDMVFILLGESGSRTTRSAFYEDHLQQSPSGVDAQIKECEEVLGWDHCLGVQFPFSSLTNTEHLHDAAERAAQATAAQIISALPDLRIGEHPSTVHQAIQPLLMLIDDYALRQRCEDLLFADRHFDRVIREACVILEDRVRNAIGAEKLLVGTALMERAFRPKGGALQLSALEPEQRGAMSLYSGIMAFFRNATSHHVADTYTREDALRFVLWIDVLLKMVATATPKAKQSIVPTDLLRDGTSVPPHQVVVTPALPVLHPAKGQKTLPPTKEKKASAKKTKPPATLATPPAKVSTTKQKEPSSQKKTTPVKPRQPVSPSPTPSNISPGLDRQHMVTCLVATYNKSLQDYPDGWVPITVFGSKLLLQNPTFKATFYPTVRLPTFLKQQNDIFQTRTKNKHLEVKLLGRLTVKS